jgi:hypothetical protein
MPLEIGGEAVRSNEAENSRPYVERFFTLEVKAVGITAARHRLSGRCSNLTFGNPAKSGG